MTQLELLNKIHEDLEVLKRDMAVIKEVIRFEPVLKNEIKQQVKEARERIAKGKFISNKDILKEFEVE